MRTGMWVMPGFIDTHGHNGDPRKAPNASYGYKLWLAHGVTTVRGVPFYFGDVAQTLSDRARSAANTIVAPRLVDLCGARRCLAQRRRAIRRSRRAPGCAGPRRPASTASNSLTWSRRK